MEGGEATETKEPSTEEPEKPIGLMKALSDPDYSDTSRFCFALAFFNQMTGVTALLVYVPQIFTVL